MGKLRTILFAAVAFRALADILPGMDRLHVGEGMARAGAEGIPVTISAAHEAAIQGFSVSLWFSPRDLSIAGVTYAGTPVESLNPEYFASKVDSTAGNVALAVIFEVSAPYDLVSLPTSPVALQPLAAVVFNVLPEAIPGEVAMHLASSPGAHPIRNLFIDLGTSIFPTLEDGTFKILPRQFRRGYINSDGRIDISDAIYLFGYLFLGNSAPQCPPAANVNGDLRVDLSDGIWLLIWLFRGGMNPPEPFLECGDDPGSPMKAPCSGPAACP